MKNHLVTIVILIFAVVSCKNNNSAEKTVEFTFSKLQVVDSSKYSSLIDHISIIPLDTANKIFISNRSMMELFSGNYFILQEGTIYEYNETGKFVHKMPILGKGPNEVIETTDFLIDTEGNLEILSIMAQNITKYDNSGKFIEKIPTPVRSYSFSKTRDGGYWLSKGAIYFDENPVGLAQVYKIDNNGNIIAKCLSRDAIDFYGPLTEQNFSSTGNSVYYKNMLYGRIYRLLDTNAIISYSFDFGEYQISEDVLKLDKEKILEKMTKSEIISINTFHVNENYLYACFMKEGPEVMIYHFIYDIKHKKYLLFSFRIKSPEAIYFSTPKILTADNELVFIVEPEYFNEISEEKRQSFSSKLKSIRSSINKNAYILKLKIDDSLFTQL